MRLFNSNKISSHNHQSNFFAIFFFFCGLLLAGNYLQITINTYIYIYISCFEIKLLKPEQKEGGKEKKKTSVIIACWWRCQNVNEKTRKINFPRGCTHKRQFRKKNGGASVQIEKTEAEEKSKQKNNWTSYGKRKLVSAGLKSESARVAPSLQN